MLEQSDACSRRLYAPPRAGQQRYAEFAFQLSDALADCGRFDVRLGRRLRNIAVIAYGDEQPQGFQVGVAYVPSPRF